MLFEEFQVVNSRVAALCFCLVPLIVWTYQYKRQAQLDHDVALIPLGASYDLVEHILGEPDEIVQTEGTGVYCYFCDFPFSQVHPEEWQLEFLQQKLIRKESTTVRPRW